MSQIASRGCIGNDRQKKKHHAAGQIGEDGKKIPQQRRAKIGPDLALARVRNQPEEKPRPSQVADRDDRADGQRENRDGFGASRDWSAPSRIRQAQNRGDQRAGMADADPKNEIGDVESPEHRPVQAPHAKAVIHLIAESKDAGQNHAAANAYGQPVCGAAAEEGRSRSSRICSAVFAIFPGFALEIVHVRFRAEFAEQLRRATRAGQARNFAIRIVQVAKDHGFGARRIARRPD